MATKEPRPNQAKRRSKAKGKAFEQRIARDFREVFDGPELAAEIAAAKPSARTELMKLSCVKRGRQGEGAVESDVHVEGSKWWFELQHANAVTPIAKLEQAERDSKLAHDERWPVAITYRTGAKSPEVTMRCLTLLVAMGVNVGRKALPLHRAAVTLDYQDFLRLLRDSKV